MATQPKTLTQFNDYLSNFFRTVLPKTVLNTLRGKDIMSYKLGVFDEVFGKGVFSWEDKELISKAVIIFEDSPTGVVGIKAVGLRESFFNDAINQINLLKAEQKFKDNLAKLFTDNPNMKNEVANVMKNLILIFADRRAKCRILIEEELQAYEEANQVFYTWVEPPTPQSKYQNFLMKVKNIAHNIVNAKNTKTYKNIVQIKDEIVKRVGSSFSIVMWAGIFSGARKLFGKIPILLGPVPLKHVDYVEIARSGKILKFRATGTVFLAKQEGGADAIKIEGTMYKLEFALMFLLWGLFIYGQSKFKELEDLPNLLEAQNVFQVRKMNDLIMTDATLERPSYEYHRVFPFVSRHFIIPNCYIETISIEDKLPLKDVLKYSILLRTYDKPKEINYVKGTKGKLLYGIANKTASAKICEASLNAGWRMLNSTGWIIDETEWKIGSATKEGVLDTYYDVDWSTIASVAYLSLMGAVI